MFQRENDGGEERRYQKMLRQRSRRLNIRTLHQEIFYFSLQADIFLTTSITDSLMICFIRICVETLSVILMRDIIILSLSPTKAKMYLYHSHFLLNQIIYLPQLIDASTYFITKFHQWSLLYLHRYTIRVIPMPPSLLTDISCNK